MATPENLFDSTQNFMTPDLINRVSKALHEPEEKVEDGLRTVIPTFLSGLIDKGTTIEGAEDIVHLVEEENFDTRIPSNLNDQSYLSKGEHAVEDIFGANYHSVANSLSPTTGMSPDNVEKMMDMIAPVVMGVIGSKVRNEGLSPMGLSGFLEQQKKVLKGFTPKISREKVLSRNVQEAIEPMNNQVETVHYGRKKTPFAIMIGLLALLLTAVLFVISRNVLTVSEMQKGLEPVYRSPASAESQPLTSLPGFLKESSLQGERFYFSELYFNPGTTDLSPNGDQELNFVSQQLKAYPKSQVRVEAFMEETGDPDENLLQSENRAMLVREELIGRGVEPSRIRAVGGKARSDGPQVELVITK